MLTQCPVCDYSFEGLPENHFCPECGFAYSAEMMVFPLAQLHERRGEPTRRFWLVLVAVVMTVAFCIPPAITWITQGSVGTIAILFLPLIPLGVVMYKLWLYTYVKPYALLTDEGIMLMRGQRCRKKILWETIGQTRQFLGQFVVKSRKGRRLAILPIDTWNYCKEQVGFMREVKRRLAERDRGIKSSCRHR